MSLVKWNCYWSLVTIQISPDFCFWKIEKKIENLNKTLCFLKKMNTKHNSFRNSFVFVLHVSFYSRIPFARINYIRKAATCESISTRKYYTTENR